MTEVPQSFDRFEIVRVLGRGGMGTVYLARDRRLGRQVALKVLNSDSLEQDDKRARFMREAKAAAAIRHQNVATIYEVDETEEGQPFIVMEYCEGETLSQRMRRRPLDSGEFLQIARQIASGLCAAHENGVVHRDIKSANIIIEPNGLVKILDFGLAKLVQRLGDGEEKPTFESTSGHFFGTLHYLSPEQARGVTADERSDLFAVGVVLYQMAAGHLPFNAESPLMVIDKIRDSEPEPFTPVDSAFPTAAAKIIGRLLQKDPATRYQSARQLSADLEEIDTPTLRMPTTAMTRSSLPRTVKRARWGRAAISAAALIVVAIAVFFIQRSDGLMNRAEAAPQEPIRSLAILPLQNITNNTQDEFLSIGMADALVTKLQQIPALQVRPTSAVMEFAGKKVDARSASAKLQVDGVLEGSFLAAGDLVRVQLQLTDTRTGYTVWTDSVDGRRDNLLDLIDDVSSRTVSGLNAKLGIERIARVHSEPRSTNPKAYEEYIKARALTGSLLPLQYQAQIAALKRAIDIDPNFAAAYADLAIALSLGQARSLATEADVARAEWYARQAVRLDPNLPQAHLAMGRVLVRDPERFTESVREVLAALRINANDTHALYSMLAYFVSTGDMQKAQCIGDQLIRIDPLSNEAKTRGYWYINAADPESALRNAQYAMTSRETELAGRDIRGMSYIALGDFAAAQKEADAASKLVPSHYIGKSLEMLIAAARGNRVAMEAHRRTFEADAARNHWAALRVALAYSRLGERDLAIEWLRKAASGGNHSWYFLVRHPWLQPLQSDPEFQQIISDMKVDLDDVRDDVTGVFQLLCR